MYTDPFTQLDNSPQSLAKDAVRALFLFHIRSESPQYITEWNRRFVSNMAWQKADLANRRILEEIAKPLGVDPTTL